MNKDYVRAYFDKFKSSHKGLENLNVKVRSDYPIEMQQSKSAELKNDIKKNPLIEKVKSFCKERDAKQKAPEKSLGMER